MSQAAKAQEPSMEEILASIRRIIADDEGKRGREKRRQVLAYVRQRPEERRPWSARS